MHRQVLVRLRVLGFQLSLGKRISVDDVKVARPAIYVATVPQRENDARACRVSFKLTLHVRIDYEALAIELETYGAQTAVGLEGLNRPNIGSDGHARANAADNLKPRRHIKTVNAINKATVMDADRSDCHRHPHIGSIVIINPWGVGNTIRDGDRCLVVQMLIDQAGIEALGDAVRGHEAKPSRGSCPNKVSSGAPPVHHEVRALWDAFRRAKSINVRI